MTIGLSFGTAGIRAALGPGLDQINLFTVGGVAHALCGYLCEAVPDARERGLCVAFDGRTDSDVFAREVVRVAQRHGFLVRAFERPTATPLLAFATRRHGAAAGLIVTASHNPPSDNGLKIYLQGGAQVLAPHDRAIAERIARFDPAELACLPAPVDCRYEALGERELHAYLELVMQLVAATDTQLPPIGYSALCGVGSEVTRQLLARAGVSDVQEVSEQAAPRADFGGLEAPNPEHESALAALRALSEARGLDLSFAHDPDADRLAVLARDRRGVLRALSGDEVGALLGDFMLSECQAPERALLVSTLVSGELLERIASARGAHFERTPTGFKWIASRGRAREQSEGLHFIFGYEEAIGYAFGSIADDKDGIAALYVVLELARRLRAQGQTLCGRLDALAREHGVFATRQVSVARGAAPATAPDLMARLRQVDPARLLGPGATRADYASAPQASELLVFRRGASRLCVRPSGTEPKLKLYLHVHAEVEAGDLDAAEAAAMRALDELEARARSL